MRISNNGLYACAKQNVIAVLVATNGKCYVGYNGRDSNCECGRMNCKSGENYSQCSDVCKQQNHAEAGALKQAGGDAIDSTIYLFGHVYCCSNCIKSMEEYGVRKVIFPQLDNKVLLINGK